MIKLKLKKTIVYPSSRMCRNYNIITIDYGNWLNIFYAYSNYLKESFFNISVETYRQTFGIDCYKWIQLEFRFKLHDFCCDLNCIHIFANKKTQIDVFKLKTCISTQSSSGRLEICIDFFDSRVYWFYLCNVFGVFFVIKFIIYFMLIDVVDFHYNFFPFRCNNIFR